MTKEQKQIAITVLLIPFLIIVVVSNMKKVKSGKAASAKTPSGVTSQPVGAPEVKIAVMDDNVITAQKKRAQMEWGRDPFSSEIDKADQIAELKLKGISVGEDKVGYAFINNEIVKKGDKLGDYDIIEISKNRVLVKKGSQSFYLVFPSE